MDFIANTRVYSKSDEAFLNKRLFSNIGMPKMLEVSPGELIGKVAEELKKEPEIKAPAWAAYAKTGMHKERPPQKGDWWHVRAAAVLRSVARLGPVGASKLTIKYGGKKNRGHKTEHFYKGSGSVARKVLQQLEKAGLLRQAAKGTYKGRVITKKAAELMNSIALSIGATKKEGAKKAAAATASKSSAEKKDVKSA